MKKETRNLILGIIGIVVLFVFILIFSKVKLNNTNNSNEDIQTKTLTLTKDNFVILDKSYMNTFQETSCFLARAGDCSWIGSDVKSCDSDSYWITLRLINFPQEIDATSSTEINHNLIAKAYSNGEQVGWKNSNGTFYEISFMNGEQGIYQIDTPLKYIQENNLILCFQINGTEYYHNENSVNANLVSNEVCLDAIKINALC